MSEDSTAGHIGARRDIGRELEAALSGLRRRRTQQSAPQPDRYGSRQTPAEALTVFTERQDAYSRSIAQGLLRLEALRVGEEMPGELLGTEPWPELVEQLGGYRFPRRKRVFDMVVAAVLLLLLMPLLIVIAVAVRVSSRGPAIYRAVRLGEGGKTIVVRRFRTMSLEATEDDSYLMEESSGALFKLSYDPRITSFGRLLRRTSLDELPQLFSVLGGDISLVGPPALRPNEIARFEDTGRQLLRLRPGITGPWQLHGLSRDWAEPEELVRVDYLYAQRWSLRYDLKLLAQSAGAILREARYERY